MKYQNWIIEFDDFFSVFTAVFYYVGRLTSPYFGSKMNQDL